MSNPPKLVSDFNINGTAAFAQFGTTFVRRAHITSVGVRIWKRGDAVNVYTVVISLINGDAIELNYSSKDEAVAICKEIYDAL
ncbi:TPA: hypothetical protein ACXJST_000355 [Stenotrophomonas maltophilia]